METARGRSGTFRGAPFCRFDGVSMDGMETLRSLCSFPAMNLLDKIIAVDLSERELMTQNELMAAIEALPKEVQFSLASSVLDRLSADGPPPISESLKAEFMKREAAFLNNPQNGEPWETVREEIFGK
jgi:Putative addiction module component